jgi:hypothetical protein
MSDGVQLAWQSTYFKRLTLIDMANALLSGVAPGDDEVAATHP